MGLIIYFSIEEFFNLVIGESIREVGFLVVLRNIFKGLDFIVVIEEDFNFFIINFYENFMVKINFVSGLDYLENFIGYGFI